MSATPTARIGHVHLRVSDLDRAIAFYSDILGFALTQRYGSHAAFLAAGDYHHHIGLNTWERLGATPPPKGHTGLFHTAFLYPNKQALANVVKRVVDAGIPLDGAADHGVSQAVYLRDPDENGVELYFDKPMEKWPRSADGTLDMVNDPLDVDGLIALAESTS